MKYLTPENLQSLLYKDYTLDTFVYGLQNTNYQYLLTACNHDMDSIIHELQAIINAYQNNKERIFVPIREKEYVLMLELLMDAADEFDNQGQLREYRRAKNLSNKLQDRMNHALEKGVF